MLGGSLIFATPRIGTDLPKLTTIVQMLVETVKLRSDKIKTSYWVQNHNIHLVCGDDIRTRDSYGRVSPPLTTRPMRYL